MNDAISNMGDIVNKVYDDKMSEVVRDVGKELAELERSINDNLNKKRLKALFCNSNRFYSRLL